MPLHEVAHQGEQLQSQKPDGHAHTKNAIMLRARACTTSSDLLHRSENLAIKTIPGSNILDRALFVTLIRMCQEAWLRNKEGRSDSCKYCRFGAKLRTRCAIIPSV